MSAALGAYRALLHLLPRELREAHGDEMVELLADELRVARGAAARLAAGAAAAWDVIKRAPHEHWRRRDLLEQREPTMRSFFADLRFAIRSFARQKGSTGVILLTLTLAVAANTAVFTLIDGLFLRPFPFEQPNRLVYLNEQAPKWNLEFTGINYGDFAEWRKSTHLFESMALLDESSFNVSDGATAERIQGAAITYDFPKVLRLRPVLGRFFTAEEDVPKGPPVVVIGYGLWRSRFAGDRNVLGKSLRVNSVPHTIIGVAPAEGEFPGSVQLWLPLQGDPNLPYQSYSFDGVARLKAGVTIEQGRSDLLAAHRAVYAAQHDTSHVVSPRIMTLRERYVAEYKTMGVALGAGGALVLLIACANVAGAMLARAIFRQREIGIRLALGASLSRLGRQLLTESLALAVVAGAAGTLLGWWALRMLMLSVPDQLPKWVHLGGDARIIAFSMLIVAGTAVLFGLVPALEVRRHDVRSAMGSSGQRATGSVPQRRVLDGLVIVEIALAAVLLAASGLLVRAYANIRDTDPGFRADGVASFRVAMPKAKYKDGIAQRQFGEMLSERLAALPGVDGAGLVTCLPLTCHWGQFFSGEGVAPPGPNGVDPVVLVRIANASYFAAMGIKLERGRLYGATEGGQPGSARVVVVNEIFARHMWPGVSDPTGRRIYFRGDTSSRRFLTVIGVVKDVKHYGLATPMRPGLYLPVASMDSTRDVGAFSFVAHTAGDASSLFGPIRDVLHSVDPELPVFEAKTMRKAIDDSLAVRRALVVALLAFAAIALTLALGGIYAVLSYVVGHRRREIGIRMALGAQRAQVVRLVVRQGLRLVAIGLVVGIPVAFGASRFLSTLLVGVSARDPVTYAIVVALLAATGIAAAMIPARRASRVQPTVSLSE